MASLELVQLTGYHKLLKLYFRLYLLNSVHLFSLLIKLEMHLNHN